MGDHEKYYYQFYQDRETGLLEALWMNADSTPYIEQDRSLPVYYSTGAINRPTGGIGFRIWMVYHLSTLETYVPLTVEQARKIDAHINYGYHGPLFGLLFDEYEGPLGAEHIDWEEVPHIKKQEEESHS